MSDSTTTKPAPKKPVARKPASKPAASKAKTPPKGKAPVKPAPKSKAEPKAKFVIPPKPTTDPTSLDLNDYTYVGPKGERRFWQGYDAKLKNRLMKAARVLPETATSKAARKTLIERGWSTAEREAGILKGLKDRAQKEVERQKAKAAPKSKPAPKKKDTTPAPEVKGLEQAEAGDLDEVKVEDAVENDHTPEGEPVPGI